MGTPAPSAIAILAAGRGVRFGGGKLDSDCAGRPLAHWALEAAQAAGFQRHILVVRPDRPAFASGLTGWEVVENPQAACGLASSVRIAASAAKGYRRLVLALADMPLVTPAHLAALRDEDHVAFTRYPDGSRGVPAGFSADALHLLRQIEGSAAAVDWPLPVTLIAPPSPGTLRDVDTPQDLDEVCEVLRRQSADLHGGTAIA